MDTTFDFATENGTSMDIDYSLNNQITEGWTSLGSSGQASVVGAGAQAIAGMWNAYSSAKTANVLNDIQKQMSENNRKHAVIQANAALAASNQNISRLTMKYGQIKATQRTAMAANGIKTNVGSAKEVIATTDLYEQMDVNTAYANGLNAAMGYMSKAVAFSQASIASGYSRSSTGAVATDGLLTGVMKIGTTVAKNYYK